MLLLPPAGNMRGFAMGRQQFQQFFQAGSRSSLLGPVPMGVAIKSPHMGYAPRHYNPHARYMNNVRDLPPTVTNAECMAALSYIWLNLMENTH